jgi:hypothetical protein
MTFFFSFLSLFLFANNLININTNPSINAVLQVKSSGFNTVFVNKIKSYKVETQLINTSNNLILSNILLRLNIYNKQSQVIGSKTVSVNFRERKPLRKRRGFFESILYNLKNFSFKDNIRNKIKEDRSIIANQDKKFVFYFYDTDINARIKDKEPVSISVVPHSARIK